MNLFQRATLVSHCLVAGALAQGSWTTVAPMPTPRENFGIARTPDGLIYAIGGDAFNVTFVPVNIVEAYNPATNTWSTLAPMPTPRYSLTAAYANGMVYAIGGYNGAPLNTVEAYNPGTNSWSAVAPMPTPRHGMRAVTGNDGKIYVIGGDTASGGANVALLEIYDPIANSWSGGAPMPNVKTGPGAVLGNDGLIYVFGGGQNGVEVTSLFVYNTATNSWTSKAPMTVARAVLGAGAALNGKILAIGGQFPGLGIVTGAVEIYDPVTDTWTNGTTMPSMRGGLGAATGLDGRIYAIGGWIPQPGGILVLGTNEAYSPSPADQFQVRYSANLNLGDSVINITNSGARGAALPSGISASTTGAICVNVYAFSPDEQMISCCSCPVTPNGLVSISARDSLISNTLTPAVPTSIVIKLYATAPVGGSCAGSAASPGSGAPGMLAWGTSVHLSPSASPVIAESGFLTASLSSGELNRLTALCTFINATGSGFGVCRSCGLGGLGGGRL
jgi:hypothetical protein